MFGSRFEYWWLMRKKCRVSEVEWQLLTMDVNYLFEESDEMWERLAELSALVEFLVEKQEKAQKPAKAVKKATPARTTKKA